MKLKYFLRGLGTGIVFCALIMLVAYMTSGDNISDKEIIERAENLGMVMEEDVSIINKNDSSSEDNTGDITTEEYSTETTTESDKTEESTTEAGKTEDDTDTTVTSESTTEATTEEKKPSSDGELVSAKISVTSGMTSTEVALLLQEAGVIDDYLDFDQYLNENGYSTQIRINDYTFNNKMTYEEIAKALIKEDKIQ